MILIVGLGNPEPEYSFTRHNMGFDVINKIAEKYEIKLNKTKFNSIYGLGKINDEKVILVKPQTFMNLSGKAIKELMDFYKIDIKDIIIIYDDIDINIGTVRVRKKGNAGTHNGMKSTIESIGTNEFIRIRIGIGQPEDRSDLINYVIGKISKEEYKILIPGIEIGVEAVELILEKGIDNSMNIINSKS